MDTRRCSVCGEVLPLSEFYICGGVHHYYCKKCFNTYRNERRKELRRIQNPQNYLYAFTDDALSDELTRRGYKWKYLKRIKIVKHKSTQIVETRKCKCCGKELPLDMFHKTNSGKSLDSTCKLCRAEQMKKRREAQKQLLQAAQHAANLAGPDADRITTADGKTYRKVTAEPVCKELKDYTERELFAELKRRGYKWPNDVIYRKMFVNYDKIEV